MVTWLCSRILKAASLTPPPLSPPVLSVAGRRIKTIKNVIYYPINRGVDPDINTQSDLKVHKISAAGTRNKKKHVRKSGLHLLRNYRLCKINTIQLSKYFHSPT